jgi:methylenetetrahydrofolate reductase (NADPH)
MDWMKANSRLAKKIAGKEFIVTAEYLPQACADKAAVEKAAGLFGDKPVAVNVADNQSGIALSSWAASVVLARSGVEPVVQMVTRDRNRVALQSDLLGAASLGMENVLCLSGYHQTLMGCPDSANVYDIDSIQLLATVRRMDQEGVLMDGTRLAGGFAMLAGATANPYLAPLELNILRLTKKVEAGAAFIQTQAVFSVETFGQWLAAAREAGLTERTAVLAGVLPLADAEEAVRLRDGFTDYRIPDGLIDRLKRAGDKAAQRKEGLSICAEIIGQIRSLKGLRGIHILSGGKEAAVRELLSASGL